MELWIRSQDKDKLFLVKELYVFSNEPMTNKTYKIVNNYNENLGMYKTKERALEVLDEIQRILHPTMFMSAEIDSNDNNWVKNGIIYQKYKDNFGIQEISTYVYEMPKE